MNENDPLDQPVRENTEAQLPQQHERMDQRLTCPFHKTVCLGPTCGKCGRVCE